MAAIHTAGSIACFIFGGIIILIAIGVHLIFNPTNYPDSAGVLSILIAGFGAGLIALGWYIGVLSKN